MRLSKEVTVYDSDSAGYDDAFADIMELISDIDVTDIVAVADIGRWNGRVTGYTEIDGIEDVFRTRYDSARWYIDREGDLCASFSDHDGCTRCVYRQWRSNVSEATREKVLADIYNGTHKYDYRNYTKSIGSCFTDIYGITVDGREVKAVKAECA